MGQFNSFRKPLIILTTIPLGLIGVVLGLHLFRSYFGFMTLLGIVSLSGIVLNNAIVLLDRIKIEIEENGRTPQQAVIEAAQRRLRPILLTTMTTIGGLIPLYLGGGAMWEPPAVAIMCGLVFATALTLGVVPVLYSLFYRVKYWAKGTDSRFPSGKQGLSPYPLLAGDSTLVPRSWHKFPVRPAVVPRSWRHVPGRWEGPESLS